MGKVCNAGDFGRIVRDAEHTPVPSHIKIPGNGAKKNIPRDYHGMFNIPGGARNLLPLAYEKPAPKTQTKRAKTGKNREFLQKTVLLAIFYTT